MQARQWRQVFGFAALVALGAACSEGRLQDIDGTDAGDHAGDTVVTKDGDDGAPDTTADDTSVDPDGADDPGGGGSAPVEVFTHCGAGGVSTGSGLRAVQCYGPAEASNREASGSGTKWQAGAFRIVSESN